MAKEHCELVKLGKTQIAKNKSFPGKRRPMDRKHEGGVLRGDKDLHSAYMKMKRGEKTQINLSERDQDERDKTYEGLCRIGFLDKKIIAQIWIVQAN